MFQIPETPEQRWNRLYAIIVRLGRRVIRVRGHVSEEDYYNLATRFFSLHRALNQGADLDVCEHQIEDLRVSVELTEQSVHSSPSEASNENSQPPQFRLWPMRIFYLALVACFGAFLFLFLNALPQEQDYESGEPSSLTYVLWGLGIIGVNGGVLLVAWLPKPRLRRLGSWLWSKARRQPATGATTPTAGGSPPASQQPRAKGWGWKLVLFLILIGVVITCYLNPSLFYFGWGAGAWVLGFVFAAFVLTTVCILLIGRKTQTQQQTATGANPSPASQQPRAKGWGWWIAGGIALLVSAIVADFMTGLGALRQMQALAYEHPPIAALLIALGVIGLGYLAKGVEGLWTTIKVVAVVMIIGYVVVLISQTVGKTWVEVVKYANAPPSPAPRETLKTPEGKTWDIVAPQNHKEVVEVPKGWDLAWAVIEAKPTSIIVYVDGKPFTFKPGEKQPNLPNGEVVGFQSGERDRPVKVRLTLTKL